MNYFKNIMKEIDVMRILGGMIRFDMVLHWNNKLINHLIYRHKIKLKKCFLYSIYRLIDWIRLMY